MFKSPKTLVRSVPALGAALAMGFVLASCGGGTVNTQKAESLLKQKVAAQTGVSIASVSCPSNVPAKKGGTFVCTAHGVDGTHAPVSVTQTDANGNVSYSANLVKSGYVQTRIIADLQTKFKIAVN